MSSITRSLATVLNAAAACLTVTLSASGQQVQTEAVGLRTPEKHHGAFGQPVAIDGEWALIQHTTPPRSTVKVYRREPSGWRYVQNLRPEERWAQSYWDSFGGSMAIDGDRVAIGDAYDWGIPGSNIGRVTIFEQRDGRWFRTQNLDPPALIHGMIFGAAIALDGDTLAVSAPAPNVSGGEIYIYEHRSSGWELVDVYDRLHPDDVKNKDQWWLGGTMALHGDTIAAGVSGLYGTVHILNRTPHGWKNTAIIEEPSPHPDDYVFPGHLALWGDTLVVGKSRGPVFTYPPGKAYVYEKDPQGSWSLVQTIRASDGYWGSGPEEGFGGMCAIEGDRIVVGAKGAIVNGKKGEGAVYVFFKDPVYGWPTTEDLKLVGSRPQEDTWGIGLSVGFSDGVVLATENAAWWPGDGRGLIFELELGSSSCTPTANSTGKPARLAITGWPQAAERNLVLSARDCPSGVPAVFLMSDTLGTPNPFGSGRLCLVDPLRVSEPIVTGAGFAIHQLDFDRANVAGKLLPGTTWSFQLLYQDPPGSPNLSNAVELTLE